MSPKIDLNKKIDTNRSVIVVPSRLGPTSHPDEILGAEETEIAAEIMLPEEGGWGWVVVATSFTCLFILDGIIFTFGSLYPDIVEDLEVEGILVALVNSVAVAIYFIAGPLTSALINRFGFRAVTMAGSIIVALCYLCSYFATNYVTLLFFYGFFAGFGGCLVAMPSVIVVGFYFERLRGMAMAIAGTGTTVGVMIFFSINSYLVSIAGWRITTLIHSGLVGSIYFLAMAYRPVLSLTVTNTTEDPTRTVTYLPSLTATPPDHLRASRSSVKREIVTPAERLFSAVSNAHFPTAASVIEEGMVTQQHPTPKQAGPSSATVSKLTITARSPEGGISKRQLKQVQSIRSRHSISTPDARNIEVTVQVPQIQPESKQKWWTKLCGWQKHIPESRPMYRDDVFYNGKIENLPAYQKSMMDTAPEARTGLEYQMAVSRAVTTADLEDRRGVFTTAVRRILATMMDPTLLRRRSFLLICLGGILAYIGLLVPYILLPEKSRVQGIDAQHYNFFVSLIGLANTIGRLVAGAIFIKYDKKPLEMFLFSSLFAGIGTMSFSFSLNVAYQYFCCVFFGIFISFVCTFRSLVLVDLYGLDMLTSATGILLMAQGVGSLISTPLAGILQNQFNYDVAFFIHGLALFFSGVVIIPVKKLIKREKTLLESEVKKLVDPIKPAKAKN